MDYDVTIIGRRPLGALQRTTLLNRGNVRHVTMDVCAPRSEEPLRELAASADIFVMGAEPHVVADDAELDAAVQGAERVYRTLWDAGYTTAANDARRAVQQWPKRVVRVGSPPAEFPSRALSQSSPFVEDATSIEALQLRAIHDTNWKNRYFQGKVRCAVVARSLAAKGLDIVTAAPTSVISWAGDWGVREPIVQFRRRVRRRWVPFTPSTLTNVVPGDVFACGLMLAALAGRTGESYQIAGADAQTAECVQALLATVGEVCPPPRRFSRDELDHQVGLLDGESLNRTARDVVGYSGRAVENVGLMWANALSFGVLTPLVTTKIATDVVAGGVSAMRNAYDNAVTTTLWALGIERWQIALLAEMQSRGADKIRALNGVVAGTPFAAFAYPDAAEIAKRIDPSLQLQAEWLQKRGLLRGGK
jgi:hypothetical protein